MVHTCRIFAGTTIIELARSPISQFARGMSTADDRFSRQGADGWCARIPRGAAGREGERAHVVAGHGHHKLIPVFSSVKASSRRMPQINCPKNVALPLARDC